MLYGYVCEIYEGERDELCMRVIEWYMRIYRVLLVYIIFISSYRGNYKVYKNKKVVKDFSTRFDLQNSLSKYFPL